MLPANGGGISAMGYMVEGPVVSTFGEGFGFPAKDFYIGIS